MSPLVDVRRRRVALVGTYPPTECGIATFTSHVRSAITAGSSWSVEVIRVLDAPDHRRTDGAVAASWIAGDDASLRRSVQRANSADVVVIQHEFGIYGGVDGRDVVAFAEALTAPLVVVAHTTLRTPSAGQRRVMDQLIAAAEVVVVQSESARRCLIDVHGLDPEAAVMIPHGATANFFGRVPTVAPTVLTWGLLGPGKGIEHAMQAVARAWVDVPDLTYVVAGETHPKVRASGQDRYRHELKALARRIGGRGRIVFDGAYRDWASLRALARSADVLLLPYESREQVSSGVLVESLASAKPVVATRFPHAVELLSGGAGVLVDHGDVAAMSDALVRLVSDRTAAASLSDAAREVARGFLWPVVGESYRRVIDSVISHGAVV